MERDHKILLLENLRQRMGIQAEEAIAGEPADLIPTRPVTFTLKESAVFDSLFDEYKAHSEAMEGTIVLLENLRERAGLLSPKEKSDYGEDPKYNLAEILFTQYELGAFDYMLDVVKEET